MAETQTLLTADEYYHHPDGHKPGELIRGVIHLMSPTGIAHGVVVDNLQFALNTFVRTRRLGRVFGDNVGFTLAIPGEETETVRSPDLAFVRAEQVPPGGVPTRGGFLRLTPDLTVEVLSPDQTMRQIRERMADYFAAGSRVMWVVDPEARTVAVHTPDAPTHLLHEADVLDGGDVLPGFTMPVADVFEGIARD